MNIDLTRSRLDAALSDDDYEQLQRRDIAFHMTDWLDDLRRLIGLYETPDKYDSAQVVKIVSAFLVHVPNHVAAASKLMLNIPVTDIFQVGATSDAEGDRDAT